jgi:hypothetical protein
MCLEVLKGIENINGEKIIVMDDLKEQHPEKFNESGSMDYEWFEKEIRPNSFVYIRKDKNSISFTLQKGAIKENGKNGCQIDTVIAVAKAILEGLNKKLPCRENRGAIEKLDNALEWLDTRTKNRIKRGVEGEEKA